MYNQASEAQASMCIGKYGNIAAKIKGVQQFWYEVKTGKNLERKTACEDIMGRIRANKQVATLFEGL